MTYKTQEELDEAVRNCKHDPTIIYLDKEKTGGMYHCPDCGEMVIAGVAHPR